MTHALIEKLRTAPHGKYIGVDFSNSDEIFDFLVAYGYKMNSVKTVKGYIQTECGVNLNVEGYCIVGTLATKAPAGMTGREFKKILDALDALLELNSTLKSVPLGAIAEYLKGGLRRFIEVQNGK